jgi:hypothetical protein
MVLVGYGKPIRKPNGSNLSFHDALIVVYCGFVRSSIYPEDKILVSGSDFDNDG